MREMNIRSKIGKRYVVTADPNSTEPIAENLLNRDFRAAATDEKCVSDINISKLLMDLST